MKNFPPMSVSPGKGRRSMFTTISVLQLPITTIFLFIRIVILVKLYILRQDTLATLRNNGEWGIVQSLTHHYAEKFMGAFISVNNLFFKKKRSIFAPV
jgi:hypothetical protein